MKAVTRVLSQPELLASILVHLDQRALLTIAQRVCKSWLEEISSAPCLTRRLFFDVPTNPAASAERMLNPILAELFPSFFDSVRESYQSAGQNRDVRQ